MLPLFDYFVLILILPKCFPQISDRLSDKANLIGKILFLSLHFYPQFIINRAHVYLNQTHELYHCTSKKQNMFPNTWQLKIDFE